MSDDIHSIVGSEGGAAVIIIIWGFINITTTQKLLIKKGAANRLFYDMGTDLYT